MKMEHMKVNPAFESGDEDDKDADPYNRRFYHKPKATYKDDLVKVAKHGKSWASKLRTNLKKRSFYKKVIIDRVPIISWLFFEYNFKLYLISDLISGFTVGIMNLPQSMGYALLANLAPVNGLYMSFFPLLVYALFGTSRHIAIGTIAIVSLLSGEAIQTMADQYNEKLLLNKHNDTMFSNSTDIAAEVYKYKVVVACALSFFVGIIQILMSMVGLGVVTRLFSDSFVSGYTTGGAIHVLVSQLKDLFGIKNAVRFNGAFKIPKTIIDIVTKLPVTNIGTLIVSTLCIAYIIVFKEIINPRIKKKIKIEFPSDLLLVIITTVASYFLKFEKAYGIGTVKTIPTGMPIPKMPDLSIGTSFIQNGIIIAVVAFSINVSLATFFAKKNKYEINANQELFAYGASNIFGSFFACYPNAASLSRSSVQDGSGGKTQLASVFSSLIILTVILWLAPLFTPLPKACLASIIVVALKGLLWQTKTLFDLWKWNKYEAVVWFGTFLAVVLLDVDLGLVIGIALSVILIVVKDQSFQIRKLTKYNDTNEYVDQELIKKSEDITDNVIVLKPQRSLYFINIQSFKEEIMSNYRPVAVANKGKIIAGVDDDADAMQQQQKPDLIIDFSAVNYVDTGAMNALVEVLKDFNEMNVNMCICHSQDTFISMINKMDLMKKFENHLFVTVADAFRYLEQQRLEYSKV